MAAGLSLERSFAACTDFISFISLHDIYVQSDFWTLHIYRVVCSSELLVPALYLCALWFQQSAHRIA